MQVLKLTLCAPEQYFFKSHYSSYGTMQNVFLTETHPTKNAICGMLGCALGYPRGDERLENLRNSIKVYWLTVRGKRETAIDYQTITPLHRKNSFLGVDNKRSRTTLVKQVEYVVDTEFAVYVEAEVDLLKKIHYALNHPIWYPYIGKSHCFPEKDFVGYDFELEELPDEAVECF